MHVVVAVREKRITKGIEQPLDAAIDLIAEKQVEGRASLGFVLVVPVWIVPGTAGGDLLGAQAEEEHVLFANFLGDLDRGPVACPDGNRAVHCELHVARTAGFVAGGRDLLRDVAGGDEPLGQADAVVGQEDHFDPPPDQRVAVDGPGDVVDELDDQLGQPVRRRGLAGEEEGPRRRLEPWVRLSRLYRTMMCSTLRSWRLYSCMRLTWLSKTVLRSRTMPCSSLTHCGEPLLADCLAARKRSRKPVSSARAE